MAAQLDLFDPSLTHPLPKRRRRQRRNELLEVMQLALIVARRQLNDYSCPRSKHTYTQPQLLACLILKSLKKLTYRGTTELLETADGLREVLGLEQVPAYSTFKEFADRVLTPTLLDELVGQVLLLLQEKGLVVDQVAADSTGIETSSASVHFVSRAKRKRDGYVKLSLVVACGTIVLVSLVVSFGPGNDLVEAWPLLAQARLRCRPDWLLADSGYDAERMHRFCADWGTRSYIPPVPKTKDGTIKSGPGRIRCGRHKPYLYGNRWHAESFISGMKRTCGSTLAARSDHALQTEAGLKALAYAIRR
jgi:transposase